MIRYLGSRLEQNSVSSVLELRSSDCIEWAEVTVDPRLSMRSEGGKVQDMFIAIVQNGVLNTYRNWR